MKVIIDQEILTLFPDLNIGVLVVTNINNTKNTDEITKILRSSETQALKKLGSSLLIEQPFIKPWREAYRKFGAKPSEYPSSIENLLKRLQKGETLRHINSLVDIYNIISLNHFLPVGGEDLLKIKGNIHLALASNNEVPALLLGEKETRSPHPGEVIYKDDEGTLCRRWNWKEADRTKLTENTTDAILVMEGLHPIDINNVQAALDDLGFLITKFCGNIVSKAILNNSKVELVIN